MAGYKGRKLSKRGSRRLWSKHSGKTHRKNAPRSYNRGGTIL